MICTTNRLYEYSLLLFALLILARKSESAFETSESKLHSKLFKLYNRLSHPSKQNNSTVKVEFDYQLINILDVSARNQYIKTYAWVNQYWTNELLTWDPAEYDGIDQIHVDPRDIWVPDVLLYNNIDEEDRFGGGPHTYKANVALHHNGQCTWLNPAIFKSICSVDVTYFPFDDQECKLKFGSWSFDLSKVDLHPANKSVMNKNYIKNGEWQLRKIDARRNQKHYTCCKYDFVDVTITINISRVSLDYIMKLIIPCSLISSMIFLGFVLPPESGERIGLSITVLLAMTVFQQLTSELMPSYGFPLLGQYYFATMMEIGASLAITTFILNFYHRSTRRMPAFLRVVILKWITRVAFPFRKNKTIEIASRCTDDLEENDSFMETDIDNCDHTKNKQNRWINGGDFPEGYELSCSTCESTDNMYNNSSGRRKSHASTGRGIDKSRVRKYKPKHVINNEHCPDSIRQSRSSYFMSVPFEVLNSSADSEISAEKERNKKEWMKAARVLDRVFLIVSVLIGTLTLFAIFLKAPRFRLN